MRRLIFILISVFLSGVLQQITAQHTDTIVINNAGRRIFGIFNRPDGKQGEPMPLVIFAHGFNGDHKHGMKYFEPLSKIGYQCYTLDFPCGSTHSALDSNTVNMSIRDQKSDLMAVVDYFAKQDYVDSDKIVLIGGSQGGLVACLAASAMPEKIYKLVLGFAAFSIPDNYNGRFETVKEIPDTTYIWKVPIGRRFFTELRNMDAFAVMPEYKRPVLLVHGDKDPIVPARLFHLKTDSNNGFLKN